MDLYVILRRDGWPTAAEFATAGAHSTASSDEMPDDVRWIRSYVLYEADGALGSVCIYEATSQEATREHASRAGLPADEIIPIADTVLVRPEPGPADVEA
jgi:hypothetical protein